MMSWPNETYRHSLASRGIRTRAIINPVASPRWRQERYTPGSHKGMRWYAGSGLESLDKQEIIGWVEDIVILMNQMSKEDVWIDGISNDLELEIKSIYLVGSRVSGFYTSESDLDVVVEFKKNPRSNDSNYIRLVEDYMVDALMALDHDAEWLLKSGDDEAVRVDLVVYGWEGPDEGSPYLKIWEAS